MEERHRRRFTELGGGRGAGFKGEFLPCGPGIRSRAVLVRSHCRHCECFTEVTSSRPTAVSVRREALLFFSVGG